MRFERADGADGERASERGGPDPVGVLGHADPALEAGAPRRFGSGPRREVPDSESRHVPEAARRSGSRVRLQRPQGRPGACAAGVTASDRGGVLAEPLLLSTPEIARALDPKNPGEEDWQGWDYEGFFLGAQDESGDPFLAVFNFMRDHGGGQWARSEGLYPYEHG